MDNTQLAAVIAAILLSSDKAPTSEASMNTAADAAWKLWQRVQEKSKEWPRLR